MNRHEVEQAIADRLSNNAMEYWNGMNNHNEAIEIGHDDFNAAVEFIENLAKRAGAEHAPTPWKKNENFIQRVNHGLDGMDIAHLCNQHLPDTQANGEFIVHAVNCHDDLLAACVALTASDLLVGSNPHVRQAWDAMQAAIAKATGD